MVPRVEQPQHLERPTAPRRFVSNSKASFVSPSPSFEADDERSILGNSDMDYDSDHSYDAGNRPVAQYPGEDTRLTSPKELLGWYSYAWASEVFVVCGVGSFIPITLESLAREGGVLVSDHKTPCGGSAKGSRSLAATTPAVVADAAAALFDALLARRDASPTTPEKGQCVVTILGVEVSTASFAMYTFSLSVLFQALVIVSMSGAADHGRYRKKLLLSFATVGAVATMLFLPVVPSVFVLAAFLAIVANTCFGASNVLMNSFLPLLVRRHPSVQDAEGGKADSRQHSSSYHHHHHRHAPSGNEHEDSTMIDSTAALLPISQPPENNISPPLVAGAAAKNSPELILSTKLSSYGVGIGYIAAVLVQILGIVILFSRGHSKDKGATLFSLRIVLFTIGLWWLVFTIPAALFLRPRPGPPLASRKKGVSSAEGSKNSLYDYVAHSWGLLGRTILQARQLRDISVFLIAWFLLSDALATVSSTAILFAKTELQMAETALAFISVIATVFGVCGAFVWSAASRYFGLTAVQTLAMCIALFELIPLYGLLGFIPAVRNWGVFGLQQDWEMYVLGAVYGLVLGGVGSYCRSLYGELIPPGSEAAFYALYAITDKGSSIFGPAIVGAITDHYGEIRPAFVFLAVLVGLPLPLMWIVDIPRGKAQGRRLVSESINHKYSRVEDENGDGPGGNVDMYNTSLDINSENVDEGSALYHSEDGQRWGDDDHNDHDNDDDENNRRRNYSSA